MKTEFFIVLVLVLLSSAFGKESNHSDWVYLLDKDLSHFERFMGYPRSIDYASYSYPIPESEIEVRKAFEAAYHSKSVLGLNNDPTREFTMIEDEEGEPMLRISGEILGSLCTTKSYGNYHFSTFYRWGQKRGERFLNGGIFYHCTGEYGDFNREGKPNHEYQVRDGEMGDWIPLGGYKGTVRADKLPADAPHISRKIDYVHKYNPEAEPVELSGERWFTGIVRKKGNFEKPIGEWNHIELYCVGDRAIQVVNGHVVMALDKLKLQGDEPALEGQIIIEAEFAEGFYKQMKIRPIEAFPEELEKRARF